MCEECVESVKLHFPALNEGQQCELLFNATCFPFGEPSRVEEQLVDLAEKSGGDFDKAMRISHDEMDRAYEEFHKEKE